MKQNPIQKATLFFGKTTRKSFENIGKKIHQFNKKNPLQQAKLAGVDLSQFSFQYSEYASGAYQRSKTAFDDQIPNLSKRLFKTSKLAKLGFIANKFASESTTEELVNKSLNQIAKIAQKWANFDLNHDERYHANLDNSERHALAHAIADQNRTLATMGGITNFGGLVGILADTIWLLLVSLRSIFQIASIYDKPLIGKQGIAIAFEILSKVDLNKLQEKQTLLAGLGILDNITSRNIEHITVANNNPFHKPTENNQNLQTNLHTLSEIAKQMNINLQNTNLKFLHKILPITAVMIGSAYNSMIIHEVLQVSLNTFAPQPKLTNQDILISNYPQNT